MRRNDDQDVLRAAPWRLDVQEMDGLVELVHREQSDLPRHEVSFRLTLEVPPEVPLEIAVGVGDVELRDQVRSLRVAAGVGDVHLRLPRDQGHLLTDGNGRPQRARSNGAGESYTGRLGQDGPRVDASADTGEVSIRSR